MHWNVLFKNNLDKALVSKFLSMFWSKNSSQTHCYYEFHINLKFPPMYELCPPQNNRNVFSSWHFNIFIRCIYMKNFARFCSFFYKRKHSFCPSFLFHLVGYNTTIWVIIQLHEYTHIHTYDFNLTYVYRHNCAHIYMHLFSYIKYHLKMCHHIFII